MKKKILIVAVKIVFTVLLFVLLFRPQTFWLPMDFFGGITPAKMLDEVRGVEMSVLLPWLLFAAIVKFAGMAAGMFRWRLLLKGQGLNVPFSYLFQSWLVGRAVGIFLPGTIGLDGYRLADSMAYTGQPVKCATVIAVEKLIGFVALTFLVFLTFPLGFALLDINVKVFAAILFVLACFVSVAFLLLLNPRVIQILVAVVPTPAKIANTLNRLGRAATAYSGNRMLLIKATLLGLLVHLGTCFMFFGTMMAIRTANTSLWDIMFASPLMIYGTVLGPSIGGEGIREIVAVTLLSGTASASNAALFAHLGWWVGEFVPFVGGAIVMVARKRKPSKKMTEELARMRRETAESERHIELDAEDAAMYRRWILTSLAAGALGGLIGGALIGLAEAQWILSFHASFTEWSAFGWGALVYGPVFIGTGLGITCGLIFLSLLLDKKMSEGLVFALSLAGSLSAAVLVIGRFCYQRDVMSEHALGMTENLYVLGAAAGVFLGTGLLAFLAAIPFRRRRKYGAAAGVAGYAVLVIAGAVMAGGAPGRAVPDFAPAKKAEGPNVILIAIDALRADYLPTYSTSPEIATPNLDVFVKDSVLFDSCFAQASWTKPSFATIFSGRYPESHSATSKISSLPDEVTTFAEIFSEAGYYTKGFANNPNITALFNFNQGFVDYVDLKPDLYFMAGASASKLTVYDGFRKAWSIAGKKLGLGLNVTRYYQPAEVVTSLALEWLDSAESPDDTPFMLFLHYMDPHDPFMNHNNPGEGYARAGLENPDAETFLAPMREAYLSEIEHLDAQLGVLFDGLRERGLYGDSVILFVADHGEEFYEHNGWWHGQTLYDEVLHVPLILKLPGGAAGGTVNTEFVRHIDVAPTLLDAANLQKGGDMRGAPLMRGEIVDYVYSSNDLEGIALQSVRMREDKLIKANEGNHRKLKPLEYYDLVNDPLEKSDALADNLPRSEELERLMESMQTSILEGSAEPSIVSDISSDVQDQLDALGYGGDL